MPNTVPAGGVARAAGVMSIAAIIMINIWRAFGGPVTLSFALLAAAVVLVAVEYRNIPPNLRTTSWILLFTSVLLMPFAKAPLASIQRGLFIGGLLLGLMASVMLLARCALRSRRVHLIGKKLRTQQPGRRYGSFTYAGQFFSAMLGMAGANIMLVMAAPPSERPGEHKTTSVVAVTRGFSAASFWSPMFGNMAILLAIYPTLHWIEVFPVGVALAQVSVVVGILLNHFKGGSAGATATSRLPSNLAAAGGPLVGSMLAFLALVLSTSALLKISTTMTIVLLGPGVALLVNMAMSHRGVRVREALRRMREDTLHWPKLASEALLFVSAGCAGSIMGDAFPAPWVAAIGNALSGMPLLSIGFLIFSIMATALVGIHPVLTAVFLASTITPQVLGLPASVHIVSILTGWGLSASVTPFSVLSLTASRYAGLGLYQISLGRNGVFAAVNAMLACLLLTAAALLLAMP